MFRENHILAFFKLWQQGPLDRSLSNYFKAHRSLGAHDRREIGEIIYTLVRWEVLFDALDPSGCYSKRLHLLKLKPIHEWTLSPDLSPWERLGVPRFLYEKTPHCQVQGPTTYSSTFFVPLALKNVIQPSNYLHYLCEP